MGILDFLKGNKKEQHVTNEIGTNNSEHGKVTFRKKEAKGDKVYEDYDAPDAKTAREFLETKSVARNLYYITVFTPEGNWCLDNLGISLEKLLPFQSELESADCNGSIHGMPDPGMIGLAAQGITDNFVSSICCGNCDSTWDDGVGYQQETIVKCPNCGRLNSIDSSNFSVHSEDTYKEEKGDLNKNLAEAVLNQNTDEAKRLIEDGADPDRQNVLQDNASLLMLAIKNHDRDTFALLLRSKVSVDRVDGMNWSAVFWASSMDDDKGDALYFVNRLIKNGANLDTRSEKGATPLLNAIQNKSTEVAKSLIDGGANRNTGNPANETPIVFAFVDQNYEIAEKLLKAGVDKSIRTDNGYTLDFIADHHNDSRLKDLLRKY